jgi:HD-GYP domain-containing protein (c-di-GMP phosphodiesterase class II)/CHASE2 domain-containing sensor protein
LKPWQRIRGGLLAATLVGSAGSLALASGAADPWRRDAADWLVRAASAWPPPIPAGQPDVAVVAIDPQSLRALRDWPWPREVHADLVERLDALGARAVGFDIDFSTPRDPADDARFAAAIARSGRVALAAFRQSQRIPGGAELEVASVPFPALAEAAGAVGSVLVPIEPDGVVRRFPRASQIAGRRVPALAEASLALALREEPQVGAAEDLAPVDWRRAWPAPPLVSAVDVLEGRVPAEAVAGRVVLVGATAAEFQDLWNTPLGPARPGVWIQALGVRTLAAERAGAAVLRVPARTLEAALLWAVAVLGAACAGLAHGPRVASLLGLAFASGAGALAVLVVTGWLFDPLLPCASLAAHYVLGLEVVRRRFGRGLAERELSLTTLFRVGQATAAPQGPSGLDVALALLGDVVGACGVAFLRAAASGELDGGRIEWSPEPGRPVGDTETARRVLEAGEMRVFEGRLPGAAGRPGLAVYLPLRVGEQAVGVLVVERSTADPLGATELRTIATAGAQLALSAQNLRLLEEVRASFESSIAAIATAIEARDGYTESHCRRLAAFSAAMARRLALPEAEIEGVRLGALLHDVGKIGIRDEILLKPGRFSPEERAVMESHTRIGHGIVGGVHGISATTLACVRHHHERWDGTGYPDGLAGEGIPLAARLVHVVDVWDALSTRRPYKDALPQPEVRSIMEKGRGSQFDPELLDLFFTVLEEEGEEMLALIRNTSEAS